MKYLLALLFLLLVKPSSAQNNRDSIEIGIYFFQYNLNPTIYGADTKIQPGLGLLFRYSLKEQVGIRARADFFSKSMFTQECYDCEYGNGPLYTYSASLGIEYYPVKSFQMPYIFTDIFYRHQSSKGIWQTGGWGPVHQSYVLNSDGGGIAPGLGIKIPLPRSFRIGGELSWPWVEMNNRIYFTEINTGERTTGELFTFGYRMSILPVAWLYLSLKI